MQESIIETNMNNEEKNEEMLRKTVNIKNGESKWKKMALIFMILSTVFLIATITILIVFLNSKEHHGHEKEKNLNVQSEKANWEPAGNRIKTPWGEKLDPNNVWPEYPRPQLERKSWKNLNGMWDYSIRDSDGIKPDKHDGQILVPFSLESSLSGVMNNLTENQFLWYEKKFSLPKEFEGKKILLHFGAVDWGCEVYVNDDKIGEHKGGYSAFYFDVTSSIKSGKNTIVLKVIDKTDRSYQPVGKQTLTPGSIWYTAISGIWQTVWLEPVDENYIERLEFSNDFDNKKVNMKVVINSDLQLPVNINIYNNEKLVVSTSGKSNELISLVIPDGDFHPWSPSEPNLYNITVELKSEEGFVYDSIKSYTAIRKVEQKKDSSGYYRIYLNNKPIFNMGTLDQGYWPDGLYTPPSEEAMIFDIQKLKDLGFNTIRKHIKVEPFRYYYQCDKMGMLLWQDMPAGDIAGSNWDPSKIDGGGDKDRTQESKDNYYREWEEILNNLKFFQCIIIWTPFNEGWGQFETEKVSNFTREKEPIRLINAASGGNHRICGNFLDLHHYPQPDQFLFLDNMINVLGEYGGIGLEIKNHTWNDKNWGYYVVKTKEELTNRYEEYIDILIEEIKTGFSAGIYTQTTDVESEINGLITYDRKEMKIFEDVIKKANEKIIQSLKE